MRLIIVVCFMAACLSCQGNEDTPAPREATLDVVATPLVATVPGVFQMDISTGETRELAVPSTYDPTVLSPDGARLAYGRAVTLLIVDLEGGQREVDRASAGATPTDWSSNGERMLVVGGEGLTELNVTTNTITALLDGNINDAVWSPDETRIAFVKDQRLGVLDLETGRAEVIAPDMTATYLPNAYRWGDLEWTPDGESIIFGDWSVQEPVTQGWTQLYEIDAEGGAPRQLTDTPRAKSYMSFSPDGRFLAYVNDLENGARVRILELATAKQLPFDAHQGISFAPPWFDDEHLITSDGDIIAWSVDGTPQVLVERQANCYAALFGYANQQIVFNVECGGGN